MEMQLRAVRQINGDMRIDDADDDAPLLRIEFFNEFARMFSDEEKEQILVDFSEYMAKVLGERDAE